MCKCFLLLALSFFTFISSSSVSADEETACSLLAISKSGVTWDAHTSAGIFSDRLPGNVGISIFPGGDLVNFTAHEYGIRMIAFLAENDPEIVAECFVNESLFQDKGTAIGLVVNGITIKINGDEFFNILQLKEDKQILKTVIAEAALGRIVLVPEDQ